jgi:hypothetical protein
MSERRFGRKLKFPSIVQIKQILLEWLADQTRWQSGQKPILAKAAIVQRIHENRSNRAAY